MIPRTRLGMAWRFVLCGVLLISGAAATTAVAMPPDHRGLASTRRVDSGSGSCLGIGTVITRLA